LLRLVEALQPYAPEKILLFGSCARGEDDTFSDVDIVVIKDTQQRFLDRLAAVYEYVCPDYALDVLVYTPDEFAAMSAAGNPFIEKVEREGVVLYEGP
jgi:predicted nucleotidyltransferase